MNSEMNFQEDIVILPYRQVPMSVHFQVVI